MSIRTAFREAFPGRSVGAARKIHGALCAGLIHFWRPFDMTGEANCKAIAAAQIKQDYVQPVSTVLAYRDYSFLIWWTPKKYSWSVPEYLDYLNESIDHGPFDSVGDELMCFAGLALIAQKRRPMSYLPSIENQNG